MAERQWDERDVDIFQLLLEAQLAAQRPRGQGRNPLQHGQGFGLGRLRCTHPCESMYEHIMYLLPFAGCVSYGRRLMREASAMGDGAGGKVGGCNDMERGKAQRGAPPCPSIGSCLRQGPHTKFARTSLGPELVRKARKMPLTCISAQDERLGIHTPFSASSIGSRTEACADQGCGSSPA